jgi:RNA polymerase sigma-70 factor (sigma-E family)
VDDETGAIEFCHRLRPRLVGTLSLLCGSAGVAEELTQEALARTWSNWPRVRELGEPAASAWAHRVALNLARSWIRRQMAERRALARLGTDTAEHHDPDMADAITIRRKVSALPRRQRTALVLRYYTDLPIAEVAELMGCAPGTVKSLTSKAIYTLRSEIAVHPAEEVPDGS